MSGEFFDEGQADGEEELFAGAAAELFDSEGAVLIVVDPELAFAKRSPDVAIFAQGEPLQMARGVGQGDWLAGAFEVSAESVQTVAGEFGREPFFAGGLEFGGDLFAIEPEAAGITIGFQELNLVLEAAEFFIRLQQVAIEIGEFLLE